MIFISKNTETNKMNKPKKFCFSKADKELASQAHKAIHLLDKNLRKTLYDFLCTEYILIELSTHQPSSSLFVVL